MSPSCASSQAGKSVNVTNHQLAKCKSPKMQITLWERFQKSLIDHPHHPPPHPPHHEQGLSVVALQLCKVLIQLKRSPGNRCLHKFSLIALQSQYLANICIQCIQNSAFYQIWQRVLLREFSFSEIEFNVCFWLR